MLCILAATIFWFLNALNKEYTTTINFPLYVDYDREAYLPLEPLPDEIGINVSGLGWDLFRKSLGIKTPPLTVKLPNPGEVKKIVGSPGLFADQLGNVHINYVVEDTLFLDLRRKVGRWVVINVDSISRYIRTGFGLVDSLNIIPDSVYISGPENLIHRIPSPYLVRLEDRHIDEDYDEEVELKFHSLIQSVPPVVSIFFSVEPYVERSDTIALKAVNGPRYGSSGLFPDSIRVSFRFLASEYKRGWPDSLRAVLDLKGLRKGKHRVLPTLMGVPPKMQITQLDSIQVAF